MNCSRSVRWDECTNLAFCNFGADLEASGVSDAQANEVGRLAALAVAMDARYRARSDTEAGDARGQLTMINNPGKLLYRWAPIGYVSVEGAGMTHYRLQGFNGVRMGEHDLCGHRGGIGKRNARRLRLRVGLGNGPWVDGCWNVLVLFHV